jgi:AcrR family transcriptional regulator
MAKNNLRDQQRELTRGLILEALAEIMASGRFKDFTTQDVAERSGVSLATIYRHFPDRDTLLREFLRWSSDQTLRRGVTFSPNSTAEMGQAARDYYAVYEDLPDLSAAMFKVYHAGDPLIDQELATLRREKSANYERVLSEACRDVDPETIRILSELLPYLASVRVWYIFREHSDIETAHAGEVVAWVIELVVRALQGDTWTSMR